jgi:hypothetical protein
MGDLVSGKTMAIRGPGVLSSVVLLPVGAAELADERRDPSFVSSGILFPSPAANRREARNLVMLLESAARVVIGDSMESIAAASTKLSFATINAVY